MGIYIRGMEIPKGRGEYELCLCIDSDGTATVEGSYCRFEGEPFEAVPVPPHGRLIDADALEDRCSRQAKDEWNKSTGTNWGYAYATFESDVEDAPTIIPAEEGQEERRC